MGTTYHIPLDSQQGIWIISPVKDHVVLEVPGSSKHTLLSSPNVEALPGEGAELAALCAAELLHYEPRRLCWFC